MDQNEDPSQDLVKDHLDPKRGFAEGLQSHTLKTKGHISKSIASQVPCKPECADGQRQAELDDLRNCNGHSSKTLLISRIASHNEVAGMIGAAQAQATPPVVQEECGRGKRRRLMVNYCDPRCSEF